MVKRIGKRGCIFCGSNRTTSQGFRYTKTLGARTRRKCKHCKREFTVGRKI